MKIIAIDPDTEASGYALIDTDGRSIELKNVPFVELAYEILPSVAKDDQTSVYIESVAHTKHNWHQKAGNSVRKANALGHSLGRCAEVQIKLAECCAYLGVRFGLVSPLKKCWKGNNGKITHEEIKQLITGSGWEFAYKRTNQEQRDALLIAWSKRLF